MNYFLRWLKWVLGVSLPPPPAPGIFKIRKIGTFMATSKVLLTIAKPAKTAPDVTTIKLAVTKQIPVVSEEIPPIQEWTEPELFFESDVVDYDAVSSFSITATPVCLISITARFGDAAGNLSDWSEPSEFVVRDTTAPAAPEVLVIDAKEVFDVPDGGEVNYVPEPEPVDGEVIVDEDPKTDTEA